MLDKQAPPRRGAGRAVVGRDQELAELAAGLKDALGGRVRLLLVAGRARDRQDRLSEHLADHAADQRGARVLWVRCWEARGAPPFWPWFQAMRALAEGPPTYQALAAWLGPGAEPARPLVPDLAERLGAAAGPPAPRAPLGGRRLA